MRLSLLAPVLLAAGILWRCGVLGWADCRFLPGVALALFAGMLLRKGWQWVVALIVLLAIQTWAVFHRPELVPGGFLGMLTLSAAMGIGISLRSDPQWWKILGTVALLGAAWGWEAMVADLAYAVAVLIILAFVLRAEKRAA